MRTTADRLRHAALFELIGLIIVTPLGAWVFGLPIHGVGVVAAVSATIAMVWNYLYNLVFDLGLRRATGTTLKTQPVRVIHAVLFEAGLLVLLLPFIAWYLEIGLFEALVMDASFSLFYVVYAYAFNWGYDVVFPVPGGPIARRGG